MFVKIETREPGQYENCHYKVYECQNYVVYNNGDGKYAITINDEVDHGDHVRFELDGRTTVSILNSDYKEVHTIIGAVGVKKLKRLERQHAKENRLEAALN